MASRRRALRLLGSSAAVGTGLLINANVAATDVANREFDHQIEVNQYEKQFTTVNLHVSSSPNDAVALSGAGRTPYLSDGNAIYLQGNRITDEPNSEDDTFVVVNESSFVPLARGGTHSVTQRLDSIQGPEMAFMGSYEESISVSAQGPELELRIDGRTVDRVSSGQEATIEREMKITYNTQEGQSASFETSMAITIKHSGQTKILSAPSKRLIPANHHLGEDAQVLLEAQQGARPSNRQVVKKNGHQTVETAAGTARIVPTSAQNAYVLERTIEPQINGGN